MLFRDEQVRFDELTYYVAERRDVPYIQFCRFYQDGSVAFGDSGWTSLPDWAGVFYPEATRRPIYEIIEFLRQYYAFLHIPGLVNLTVTVLNVEGCARRTTPGTDFGLQPFTYDRPILAKAQATATDMTQDPARELYREVLRQSNLHPERWLS